MRSVVNFLYWTADHWVWRPVPERLRRLYRLLDGCFEVGGVDCAFCNKFIKKQANSPE